MRLAAEQIDHIISATREMLGPQPRVWLFGSRVDDTRLGGDIDLLVEVRQRGALTELPNVLIF